MVPATTPPSPSHASMFMHTHRAPHRMLGCELVAYCCCCFSQFFMSSSPEEATSSPSPAGGLRQQHQSSRMMTTAAGRGVHVRAGRGGGEGI
jgi:hypothetical protein